jgi:hypothetical protein
MQTFMAPLKDCDLKSKDLLEMLSRVKVVLAESLVKKTKKPPEQNEMLKVLSEQGALLLTNFSVRCSQPSGRPTKPVDEAKLYTRLLTELAEKRSGLSGKATSLSLLEPSSISSSTMEVDLAPVVETLTHEVVDSMELARQQSLVVDLAELERKVFTVTKSADLSGSRSSLEAFLLEETPFSESWVKSCEPCIGGSIKGRLHCEAWRGHVNNFGAVGEEDCVLCAEDRHGNRERWWGDENSDSCELIPLGSLLEQLRAPETTRIPGEGGNLRSCSRFSVIKRLSGIEREKAGFLVAWPVFSALRWRKASVNLRLCSRFGRAVCTWHKNWPVQSAEVVLLRPCDLYGLRDRARNLLPETNCTGCFNNLCFEIPR